MNLLLLSIPDSFEHMPPLGVRIPNGALSSLAGNIDSHIGNPGDERESIEANLEFARRHVDWPYIQHPMPYPGTPMAQEFRERGLVINDKVEGYDGTTAVVRSEHLPAEEIEFMRWRAERWMKVRHVPAAVRHSPMWVLRNAYRVLAHTFRGSTIRSFLGLEDACAGFAR